MYLSSIQFEKPLQPRELHRLVFSAFPHESTHRDRADPDSSAILYRMETNNRLLVQSRMSPNWTSVNALVKNFRRNVSAGYRYQFRLMANPTRASPISGERGQRIAIPDRERIPWLMRQAEKHGFLLVTANVVSAYEYRFDQITISSVTYDGTLFVTEPERFENALDTGIGAGKGWGCGLLTIAHQ